MRKKEIERKIADSFSNSVPDVLDNILKTCEKKRGFEKKMKVNKNKKTNDNNIIIEDIKPDGFVLENVESILHTSNKEAVETIYDNLNRLGYNCSMLKVNAAEHGIPQKRKRVFFLASRKKIDAKLIQTNVFKC